MSEAYSEIVLDHFHQPRNVGVIDDAAIVGRSENPASGATLELYFELDDAGVIERATFRAQGCTATIAAGSAATELLPGRTLTGDALSRGDLEAALGGLPPTRTHAYRLVTDAVRSAARQYSETTGAV